LRCDASGKRERREKIEGTASLKRWKIRVTMSRGKLTDGVVASQRSKGIFVHLGFYNLVHWWKISFGHPLEDGVLLILTSVPHFLH
jgi:ribosomal protein S1